jgi:hypothetical protein
MSNIENDKKLDFEIITLTDEIKDNVNVQFVTKKSFGNAMPLFANGHNSTISSMVKINDMFVDYSYQRKAISQKVNKIVKNFDPDLLGVITCSMRSDGRLAIIDGGHRYQALIKLGKGDMNVNALVYFDLTLSEEARIFSLMNREHVKPNPAEIFKAGIVAGDDASNAINKILMKNGLHVGVGPTNGTVRAVATLKRVYDNAGADVLDRTLATIKMAFGDNSADYRDQLISAIAFIYNRYGNNVDDKRMGKVLQNFASANVLIAQAQSVAIGTKQITYTTLPMIIISKYNVKLHAKNKLQPFPMTLLPQQVWAKP